MSTVSDNVSLTSTLLFGEYSYNGDVVIFNCVIIGSASIAWSSNEYNIQATEFTFGDVESPQVIISSNAIATLVSDKYVDGTRIITSQLNLTVTSEYLFSSVTCLSDNRLMNDTITFKVLRGMYVFVLISIIYLHII